MNGKHIYNEQFSGVVNSKLDIAEDKITKLKDRFEEVIQRESQRFKKIREGQR